MNCIIIMIIIMITIIIIIMIIISEYFNRITLQCKSTVINGVLQHKSLKKKKPNLRSKISL